MKVSALVNSFTAGELTPRLYARVDTTKFRTGAKTVHNFIVMPHGGVRKRGGSMFVAPVKEGADPITTDFQYNTEQTYLLEIGYVNGAGYVRFFTNGGILTETAKTITNATATSPCVLTVAGHSYANGEWVVVTGMSGGMTQLNNRHFKVANATTDNFELEGVDATGYDAFSVGGTVGRIVEVATPYAADEHEGLTFAQSADVLYMAHENHKIRKLSRLSATSWTISEADIQNGPFRRINSDADNAIGVGVLPWASTVTNATRANPCVITTSSAHNLRSGATVIFGSVGGMTELNSNEYEVRVLTATTFSLCDARGVPVNSSSYAAYTSGGTATQVDTKWGTISPGTTVTLQAAKDTFNADHVGAYWRIWEQGKGTGVSQPLAERNVTNTTMYTKDGKVYGVTNLDIGGVGSGGWQAEWQYPNHDKGWIHIQDENDANSFDSVYLHDSSCVILITHYTSPTVVHGYVVKNHVPQYLVGAATGTGTGTPGTYGTAVSNAQERRTWFHEEGAWSNYRGFPGLITFHEQRLWATACPGDPQVIWASVTGDFENFQDGADDDRALIYRVQSDKVEKPIWLSPGRILMMGTASGEFSIMSAGQRDEPITPSNVRIIKQTNWGSAPGRCIRIGSASLFMQRDGKPTNNARKVREFGYDFQSDSFVAPDMTILSEHMGQQRFVDAAYQQSPEPIIWMHREDGSFVGLTYEKEQQVLAWHRHNLAGDEAFVRRMLALPGNSGDDLWMVVDRNIDGVAKRYHEILTSDDIGSTAKADARYLDCHLTYDGASTTTVSGLWHLEGETVQVLADGAVREDVTVINGKITLTKAASVIHIGYVYTATLETVDIEAGAQAGTAHGRTKRISEVVLRFYRTLGGEIGYDGNMEPIPSRSSADPMDASPPLFSGFRNVDFPMDWEQEAIVSVVHSQPLPCNVTSMTVALNTSG